MTTLSLAIALLSSPSHDLTGSQLLDRCQSAYNAVRTLEVTAKTHQGDLKAEGRLFYERPGKVRVKGKGFASTYELLITPMEKWVYSVGWLKQESSELAIAGASGVSAQTATFLPPVLLGERWGNIMNLKRYPIEVTTERLGERDAYRLKAKGPNTTMSLWLDKSTFFLLRVLKDVPGGQQDITFGPYKVNQPLPAGTFDPPREGLG